MAFDSFISEEQYIQRQKRTLQALVVVIDGIDGVNAVISVYVWTSQSITCLSHGGAADAVFPVQQEF